ncbi:MAG: hypothetical protein EXS51_03430 [Candidatus Taylorbacteria bacterium]|nr:hypothetical protein [Candidatus Taylorbacteria bacterium]
MDYIWGVVEERGKPPQVFIDDRIEILNIGPSEVSRKIMYVEARCRDAQDSRVERVWLTFRRNMEYTQVKWHHLRSSHAILAPLRDPILEGVRRGKDRPPMVMAEVRFD